jgi:hypothetical protein
MCTVHLSLSLNSVANNVTRVDCECFVGCRVLFVFLCVFAKLRKATISFVMSVYHSVCPHGTTRLSTPTGRILMKFDI